MATTRLVLLPGMDGTGILFEPLLDMLPAEWEPIVVRYPPHEALGYDALLEVVQAAIPADGPFVLVGESFSGPLALLMVARLSETPGLARLQAVVLCASFVTCPLPWLPAAMCRLLDGLGMTRAMVLAASLLPASVISRVLLGRQTTRGLRELFAQARRQVSAKALAARTRAVLRVDVSEALAACPVPLLYLRATDDHVVSVSSWKLITEIKPDACLEELPGPHLLLQTQPALALAAIERFLKAHN
jgi:pimeloyl-ACP methyl ester carboxylesterase